MAIYSYHELKNHIGHDVEVAAYGDSDNPENVAVECMDCHTVIMDYDREVTDR